MNPSTPQIERPALPELTRMEGSQSYIYCFEEADMHAHADAVAEWRTAPLRAEIERLRNDLADALDCKAGIGPTALSSVLAERDALRRRIKELEALLSRAMFAMEEWQIAHTLRGEILAALPPTQGGAG